MLGKKQKGGSLSAKPQAPPSHRHSSRKVLVLRPDPNSPSKLLELTPAFVTAHDGAPQSTKRNNDNASSVRIRYRLAEQQNQRNPEKYHQTEFSRVSESENFSQPTRLEDSIYLNS